MKEGEESEKEKKKKIFLDLKYSHASQFGPTLITTSNTLFLHLSSHPSCSSPLATVLLCELRGEGLVLHHPPHWLSCSTPIRFC